MRYNMKIEQERLRTINIPSENNIAHEIFITFLTNAVAEILRVTDDIFLEKKRINTSFDELLELILTSLQPSPIANEALQLFLTTKCNGYASWPALSDFRDRWTDINRLAQGRLEDINAKLYREAPYAASETVSIDLLATHYHSITEKHVRDIVERLRVAKNFREFANYNFSLNELDSLGLSANIKNDFQKTLLPENALKEAIINSKILFGSTECYEFYTFLLRILDSVRKALAEVKTDSMTVWKELCASDINKHYACYGLKKDGGYLKKFHEAIKSLFTQSMDLQTTALVTTMLRLLEADRTKLLFRMCDSSYLVRYGYLPAAASQKDWVKNQLELEELAIRPSYLSRSSTVLDASTLMLSEEVKKKIASPSLLNEEPAFKKAR